MTESPHEPLAAPGSLRREWPFLLGMAVLLAVLLHANAPEVWFWFAALLVLLLWRWLAWASRRQARLEARLALHQTPAAPSSDAAQEPEPLASAPVAPAPAAEPAGAPTAAAGSRRSGSSGEPPG